MKRWTEKRLCEELAKLPAEYVFNNDQDAIRLYVGPNEVEYCPITALAAAKMDVRLPVHRWILAGNELGMPSAFIKKVADAADAPWFEPEYVKLHEKMRKALRSRSN